MRNITIIPVLNGFIIKVGCQTVVFTNTKTMLEQLETYYTDPDATESRYRTSSINASLLRECPPQENPAMRASGDCGSSASDIGGELNRKLRAISQSK